MSGMFFHKGIGYSKEAFRNIQKRIQEKNKKLKEEKSSDDELVPSNDQPEGDQSEIPSEAPKEAPKTGILDNLLRKNENQ